MAILSCYLNCCFGYLYFWLCLLVSWNLFPVIELNSLTIGKEEEERRQSPMQIILDIGCSVTRESYLVTQRVELFRERDSNTLNINKQRGCNELCRHRERPTTL
jgi:hypothetical protein